MFLLLQGLYVDVYGATKVEPGPNSKSLETTHSVLAQQLRDLASTNLEKSYLNDDMYVEWFLKRANYVPEEAHRLLQEVGDDFDTLHRFISSELVNIFLPVFKIFNLS